MIIFTYLPIGIVGLGCEYFYLNMFLIKYLKGIHLHNVLLKLIILKAISNIAKFMN